MKKRITCWLLLICFTIACIPSSYVYAEKHTSLFNDIDGTEYYAESVETLSSQGLISGYRDGSFNPKGSITRAEFAAIICRMIGKEDDADKAKGKTSFDDVSYDHWASGYIYVASQLGIINGYGNGIFDPNERVSYEQAIKMVVCALGLGDDSTSYPDGYLAIAKDIGITEHLKGQKGKASTRGDIAVMVDYGLQAESNGLVAKMLGSSSSDKADQNTFENDYDSSTILYCNKIDSSGFRSAVVDNHGVLWMWGTNYHGDEFGDDFPKICKQPQVVMEDVKMVSFDEYHTMVLKNDGSLWVWGRNSYGEVGDNTTQTCTKPKEIMDDVKFVAAGRASSYAIKNDGSLWAWGNNTFGQLGNGSTEDCHEPICVEEGVLYVATSHEWFGGFTYIIKDDYSLWGCGSNWFGNLGNKVPIGETSSSFIEIMEDVKFVEASSNNTAFAIKKDDSLWAWGNNRSGGIGNGRFDEEGVTVPVKLMSNVKFIAAKEHVAAIKNDGSLWVWGSNYDDHLWPDLETKPSPYEDFEKNVIKPTRVMENVQEVAVGLDCTMVLKTDGNVYTWGCNDYGQLGNGSTIDSNIPEKVIDINEPNKVDLDVDVSYSVRKSKGSVTTNVDVTNQGKTMVQDIYFYLETSDCFDHSLMANSVDGLPLSTADKKDNGYLFNTKQSLAAGDSFSIKFDTKCINYGENTTNKCGENHYITIKFFVAEEEVFSRKTSFTFEKSNSVKEDKENNSQKPTKKEERQYYESQVDEIENKFANVEVTEENASEYIAWIEFIINEYSAELDGVEKNKYQMIKLLYNTYGLVDELEKIDQALSDMELIANMFDGNIKELVKALFDEGKDAALQELKDEAIGSICVQIQNMLRVIADNDDVWTKFKSDYLKERGFNK